MCLVLALAQLTLQGEDRGSSILCRDQGVGEDAQGEDLKPGSRG